MRITLLELLIAGAAIGALCLLVLALWWSEQNRQRALRRQEAEEIEMERHIAQHCAEQKASTR
ncbi:MAG TPA: hypothetical protein PKN47_01750 [Nitrospira sp.]|nr:hypothetical protein [Nitrospira sp.]